jgi:hypothetical protein
MIRFQKLTILCEIAFMIDYVKFAKEKRLSYNKFVNGYAVFNRKTNKSFFLKTFNESLQERFYYVRDKFNLLHSIEMQKGKIALFLTSTVPSKYHDSLDIEGAYSALINFRHDLYNNFKVNRKAVKCKNINVIEPHKSMIPHQHSIFYVSPDQINLFLKHYFKTLKNHKFNKKGQDFKILDNAQYSIVYLLKYVEKSMRLEDLKDLGWFKYHGFRQFQTSNIENFNLKIWRLMINSKDYFFESDKYDLLRAYNNLEVVEVPEGVDIYSIQDTSFKIYKSAIKKTNIKSVSSDNQFLLYQDDNLIPTVENFKNVKIETEYMAYKYFIHDCPDYYMKEITPNISDNYDYNPEMVQVIQHSNCKEVIWLG